MSGFPTADTFASLVDEVITTLQGFGVNNDQVCTLSETIDAAAVTFMVDQADVVSRGIIEIDEELMWVQSSANGQLVVPLWGRGWKGTTPASHALGTVTYVAPTYPRSIVSREVNNAIRAVYPALFGTASHEFTFVNGIWQYEMPADIDRLLAVDWRWNLEDGWRPMDGYELTHGASVTDFPSGKMLSINEPLMVGGKVQVRYSKVPVLLSAPTDLYSATGLPDSSRDVVALGAAARLLPWLDAGRLPVETVPADSADQTKPVGNAIAVGREIRNLYAKRLQEERDALLARFPLRVHKVR
jgi:hypothetical protein